MVNDHQKNDQNSHTTQSRLILASVIRVNPGALMRTVINISISLSHTQTEEMRDGGALLAKQLNSQAISIKTLKYVLTALNCLGFSSYFVIGARTCSEEALGQEVKCLHEAERGQRPKMSNSVNRDLCDWGAWRQKVALIKKDLFTSERKDTVTKQGCVGQGLDC